MNDSDKQINIVPNINTLLSLALPLIDETGKIIDLYFETIVAWRVETEQTSKNAYQSSADPVTASGDSLDTDHGGAIYNRFTKEWDIPFARSGKGDDVLLKYFQEAK